MAVGTKKTGSNPFKIASSCGQYLRNGQVCLQVALFHRFMGILNSGHEHFSAAASHLDSHLGCGNNGNVEGVGQGA